MSGDLAPPGPTTGYYLWRLATRWRAAVDRALADVGLTHAQYALLASLYGLSRAGRQPSQRQLADVSGLDPMFVSKLARSLERAGLLTRTDNPADPRAFQLTMTPRGTEVIRAAMATVRDLNDTLTRPIGGSAGARNQELIATLRTLLGETLSGETP
jgi:MarR family transcriptional regulator, organic hydroperoxide resistance regulator